MKHKQQKVTNSEELGAFFSRRMLSFGRAKTELALARLQNSKALVLVKPWLQAPTEILAFCIPSLWGAQQVCPRARSWSGDREESNSTSHTRLRMQILMPVPGLPPAGALEPGHSLLQAQLSVTKAQAFWTEPIAAALCEASSPPGHIIGMKSKGQNPLLPLLSLLPGRSFVMPGTTQLLSKFHLWWHNFSVFLF